MLEANSLSEILLELQNHGYWVLLLLLIIDGPIITYVAAFASALGIFNVYWVFLLSLLGNALPDKLLYLIGRSFRTRKIEKFVEFFGVNKRKIKALERHLTKHLTKTLIFTKLVPPLPVPAMLLSGFIKVNFRKFFIITTIFDVVVSLAFSVLGYSSGYMTDSALKYLKLQSFLLPIAAVITVILYHLIRWLYNKLAVYFKE